MNNPIERNPTAAGQMYPADPAVLSRALSELFSAAKRRVLSRAPLVVIAPHSALDKSGNVAASAFAHLLGQDYDVVVVIAPSHSGHFPGVSIFSGESYATPLGKIEVDGALATEMGKLSRAIFPSTREHLSGNHGKEFSLEMVLPFLQLALGKFTLAPIITGDQDINSARALGDCLYSALKNKNALVVVSTDLSHYHTADQAQKSDSLTTETVLKFEPEKLINLFQAGRVEACGIIGLIASLIYAQRIGIDEIEEITYEQSKVSETEVIGHSALILTRGERRTGYTRSTRKSGQSDPEYKLSDSDKELLKELTRQALVNKLAKESEVEDIPSPEVDLTRASAPAKKARGVFVSVYKDKKLVGRAGFLRSKQPLIESIGEIATTAFFDSSEIPVSVSRDEFDKYQIKIHVLEPLENVRALSEIDLTRHGILVKLDLHSAYLFPDDIISSGTETETTVEQALEQVCLKAELALNDYKDINAEIYSFTVDTF